MSGWDNGDSGGWRGRDSGGGGGRDRNGDSYRDRQANGGGGWRDEGSRPGQGRDGRGDNRYDSRGDRYPRDDNRGESRGGYGDRDRDRRSGGGRGGWNSGGGGGGGWDDQRGGGGQGWNDSANGWDDGGGRPKLSAPQQQQQAKASNGWSTNTNGGGGDGWSSVAGNGGGGNGWGDDWGAQGGGQGGGDAAAKPWWEQDNHEGGWEETHKGLKKFQDKWDSVVMLEQREQRRETEDRRENWPEERLEREGYMLTGLRAEHKGSMYGKSIIVFKFDHGRPIPFTKFATGDSAVMTRVSPAFMEGDADAGQGKHGKERKEVELTIMDKGAETLRALCDHLPKSLFGTWRLDKGENTVMFQRMDRAMREGLERVLPETLPEDPDVDACFEKEGGGKNAKPRELLFIGTTLHDVLFRPEEGGAQKPSGLFKDRFMKAAKNLLAGDSSNLPPYIAALNESQKRAIATALLHRVSLTQGPPGTGKTTTVVRLIALMRKEMGFKYPILACAQSNVAVDNLLEGLRDLDVQAVRVGQPVKVRDSLRDATVDAEMRSMDGWSELCSLENDLERKRRSEKKMNGGYERQLNEKLRNIKKGIIKGVLKKAEVICATCTGAGAEQLLGFSFPIVVLDEATQCAEPESVIPIAKGCRHLVLVGDHHQLPPVCVSEEAAAKGLGTSLFDRLMRLKRGDKPADAQPQQQQQFRRPRGKAYFPRPEVAGGSQEDRIVPAALLGIQYRMHSSISAFPCKHFYCGKLLDGTPDEKRPRPIFPWPVEGNQCVFVHVNSGAESTNRSGSKMNRPEAQLAALVVRHLLAVGERKGSIGVVTPYTAQVAALAQELGSRMVSRNDDDDDPLAAARRGPEDERIEVKTVDGYQGREKEIIVFSTVRANQSGSVGFLEDWRRMNVGITRARRAMIILGNGPTLSRDEDWGNLIEHLSQVGSVIKDSDQLTPHLKHLEEKAYHDRGGRRRGSQQGPRQQYEEEYQGIPRQGGRAPAPQGYSDYPMQSSPSPSPPPPRSSTNPNRLPYDPDDDDAW